MPNRVIKESINESLSLTSCSIMAQDLYKRLITYADDYGRFNADAQIMLARLYPRELDCVSQDDIINATIELAGVGKIQFYTSWERKEVYGAFPNWESHQRLRNSRLKCPEPNDTEINDWYLKRYVSSEMKAAIIERDGFKCQECKRTLMWEKDAIRLVKLHTGLVHIDHLVPVSQGGRATMENLRLTCSRCYLKRKRNYTFDEIVEFSSKCGELRRVAASCGELRLARAQNPNPNPNPNPIQSNPKSKPNPTRARESGDGGDAMRKYFDAASAIGLPWYPSDAERATRLAAEYTGERLLLAIERTGLRSSRNWGTVEAILGRWKDQGYVDEPGKKTKDEPVEVVDWRN